MKTTFDILFFIKYPPPYPQPTPDFYDPRTGALFDRAWPDHKIGVNLFHHSAHPSYPEAVDGIPVIVSDRVERYGSSVFAPSWRIFAYSWERVINAPGPIFEEIIREITKTAQIEPPVRLDRRDEAVLRLIALGVPYREIGDHLGFTKKTISNIVTDLKDRFAVDSVPGMIGRAVDLGIISTRDLFVDYPAAELDKIRLVERQKTVRK